MLFGYSIEQFDKEWSIANDNGQIVEVFVKIQSDIMSQIQLFANREHENFINGKLAVNRVKLVLRGSTQTSV